MYATKRHRAGKLRMPPFCFITLLPLVVIPLDVVDRQRMPPYDPIVIFMLKETPFIMQLSAVCAMAQIHRSC